MDLKIVIAAISCLLGYLSHFYFRFPKNAPEVALCLAGYCVLMAIHYWIENHCEKGAFFISKSHEVREIDKPLILLIVRLYPDPSNSHKVFK